ncbi:hypothetical protein [Streptomyces sp. URMC 125]|uniref:hypothetical protein n=1 Tax=Streptomyces sp. URMC 125 TaxID=3423419 RepID=UPI003F1BC72B
MGIFRSPAAAARSAARALDRAADTITAHGVDAPETDQAVRDAALLVDAARREGASTADIRTARRRG